MRRRFSFSEESLLHSPFCFQWNVLVTIMFNHACMPHVSSSECHHTIDVVVCHVGRQNSYSHCDIGLKERTKVTAKRGNGKVFPITAVDHSSFYTPKLVL